MTGFRVALSFLTILPVGPRDMPEKLASGRAYFPLVGLFLGSGLAALDIGLREIFPPLLVGAILLVSLIVATRGLHMDGFLDSCDALVGGLTRERRLEIMRDPPCGSLWSYRRRRLAGRPLGSVGVPGIPSPALGIDPFPWVVPLGHAPDDGGLPLCQSSGTGRRLCQRSKPVAGDDRSEHSPVGRSGPGRLGRALDAGDGHDGGMGIGPVDRDSPGGSHR